jgi:hypothetical protein
MAKTVLSSIQKVWKYKKFLKSDNLEEVQKAINEIVAIYEEHQRNIKTKEEAQDFSNVEGVDFNVWAYVQITKMQAVYFDLKNKYHDLHFDKYQFNTY